MRLLGIIDGFIFSVNQKMIFRSRIESWEGLFHSRADLMGAYTGSERKIPVRTKKPPSIRLTVFLCFIFDYTLCSRATIQHIHGFPQGFVFLFRQLVDILNVPDCLFL